MTPTQVLEGARLRVASGWGEPLSLDARGSIAVGTPSRWCVHDALEAAAGPHVEALLVAEDVLQELVRALAPKASSLSQWLATSCRTHPEVLQLLARAAARARIREAR